MSQTVGNTHYAFSIYCDAPNASISSNVDLYAGTGGNDELALAIIEALNNVAWPSGVSRPVTMTKTVESAVVYNVDTSTTPPVFT